MVRSAIAAIFAVCISSSVWADVPVGTHPAVVRVVAPENNSASSYGSGVLVAVDRTTGLVLTNWHVVRDAAGPLVVYFPDGFRSRAYLLRTDRDWDLAALAIRRPNVQPVVIASEAPRPGDALTIAGYGSGSYRTITGRCTNYFSPDGNLPREIVELSVAAREGDSGGPIFNSRGELAGVLFGADPSNTVGSYCGRVRVFLASADGDFRRVSAWAANVRQSPQPFAAAMPAVAPPIAAVTTPSTLAAASIAPPAVAPVAQTAVNRPIAPAAQPAPVASPIASPAALASIPNASRAGAAAAANRPCSMQSSPRAAAPISDSATEQIKTVLAIVGIAAMFYFTIRFMGAVVG
jgi:hypothetical protein